MRFLIFAFLAVAVNATYYGGHSYYPTSSYSSSYPSSSYYGGYGSSLYGTSYGSGLGYGSGSIGYGSGIGYGSSYGIGGGHGGGHYTTYQTARSSDDQYYGTGGEYKAGYSTHGAPGRISFTLGGTGYQTGPSAVSGYEKFRSPVLSKPAGVFRQRTASIHRSGVQGVAAGEAPGKITFTQDFSGISGTSGLHRTQGVTAFRKTVAAVPVLTVPVVPVDRHSSTAFGDSGSSIKTDAYGTGGASEFGFQGVGGFDGYGPEPEVTFTGFEKISSPVATPLARPFTGSSVGFRTSDKSAPHTLKTIAAHPQGFTFKQDFSKVSGHSGVSAIKPEIHTYQPVRTVVAPKRSYGVGTVHRSSGQGTRATGGQPHMSFTQDFSKIRGQPNIVAAKPEIQNSFNRVITPVRTVSPKRPTGSFHASRTILKSGPQIQYRTEGYLQDFGVGQDVSTVTGHSGVTAMRPEIHNYDKFPAPLRPAVSHRAPARRYGSSGAIRRTGFLGSTAGQLQTSRPAQISFIQDFSKSRGQAQQFGVHRPEILSFGKVSAPAFEAVAPPSAGSRYETFPRRPTQSFSAAGPSRISFIQDFSKVGGHQTSGIRPVVSTAHERGAVPAFPGRISTQGYQNTRRNTLTLSPAAVPKPVQKPVTDKLVFKAPKQPVVVQQPTFTNIYDQGITGGAVEGHIAGDKSSFTTGPEAGFVGDHVLEYMQEIAPARGHGGDKISNVLYAPETRHVYDRSSAVAAGNIGGRSDHGNIVSSYEVSSAGHTGDKSNIFVAVPVDDGYDENKSSELLHSSGIATAGGFGEDKGSVYQLTSGNIGSGIAETGQSGYSAITTPFKDHHSSSYAGYSHLSGESPRYDFSPDRSLLYTYSSPHLASPFSYTYTSGKGQYDQVYRKPAAA